MTLSGYGWWMLTTAVLLFILFVSVLNMHPVYFAIGQVIGLVVARVGWGERYWVPRNEGW